MQLQRGLDGLAVDLGVVDRDRRAPGELLGQCQIGPAVPARVAGPHERQDPQCPVTGDQRHDDRAPQVELLNQAQVLGVVRRGLERGRVDVLPNRRDARAGDDVPSAGCVDVRRVGLAHPQGEFDLRRVGVRDSHRAEHAVVQHVDRAPVRDVRDDQVGETLEGLLVVQAARKFGRRGDQERHLRVPVLLGPLG